MAEVVYNLILAPLILFFGQVYVFFSRGTGLYGFGLIFLSSFTYFAFLPLREAINSWSAKDRFMDVIVKGKIKAIPNTVIGRERHRKITEIQNRYSYGVLNSLRASMGAFAQVPLFIIGYLAITNIPEINGRSFTIISDLGKPDQILGAVNLLPFIMTALNIATVFVEKNIDKRGRITAILISFVFLAILYGESSALLVYWTFNNLIYLCLSLVRKYGLWPSHNMQGVKFTGVISELLPPYFISVLLNAALIGGASITVLLLSDEFFYREDLFAALSKTSILSGLVLYLGYYSWRLCPNRLRYVLLFLSICIAIAQIVYIYFYSRYFGEINGGALTNESIFSTELLLIDDLAIALISMALSYVLLRRYFHKLMYIGCASLLVVVSIILFAGIYKKSRPEIPTSKLVNQGRLTANASDSKLQAANALNPEGANTVVFLLDMFEGGHISTLLQKYPDIFSEYAGFVWYSNTLSVSKATRWSVPAIYGGWDFSPERMDSRRPVDLGGESCSAYAKVAKYFSNENWKVNLVNPNECPYEDRILQGVPSKSNVSILYEAGKQHLNTMNLDEGIVVPAIANNNAKLRNYYVSLALFKASPSFIKEAVYDSGRWNHTNMANNILHKLEGLSLLHFLSKYPPQFETRNTLTFFYTDLTHTPWFLGEHKLDVMPDPYPATVGQLKVVNGVIPEQVFTEKHALALIGNYLKNLKAIGVYDNTRIIIVSDHGFGNSAQLNAALGAQEDGITANWLANNRYPGYPHALLMIKNPKDTGAFREDRSVFMSNADVFDIICEDLKGGCNIGSGMDRPKHFREAKRVLPYYDRHLEDDSTVGGALNYRAFLVTESIFSLLNWSSLDRNHMVNKESK
jgi:hypothetical protein